MKGFHFFIRLCILAIISIFQVTVHHIISQPMITVKMSNSEFVGYVPDQIVVNFDGVIVNAINTSLALETGRTGIEPLDELGQHLQVRRLIQRFPNAPLRHYQGKTIDLRGWFTVKFSDSVEVENCCDLYRQIPGVIDAQPIGIHTVDIVPNDGNFNQQWHLDQSMIMI